MICRPGWLRGVYYSVPRGYNRNVENYQTGKNLFWRAGRQYSCHLHPLIASRVFVSFHVSMTSPSDRAVSDHIEQDPR